MNSKTLPILGVVVALLAALLVISILNAPKVVIEGASTQQTSSAKVKPGSSQDVVKAGESKGVKTSVSVANQDVITSVTVKE